MQFLHVDNEESGQTARMRRLIRVLVGRICQNVHFFKVAAYYGYMILVYVLNSSIFVFQLALAG